MKMLWMIKRSKITNIIQNILNRFVLTIFTYLINAKMSLMKKVNLQVDLLCQMHQPLICNNLSSDDQGIILKLLVDKIDCRVLDEEESFFSVLLDQQQNVWDRMLFDGNCFEKRHSQSRVIIENNAKLYFIDFCTQNYKRYKTVQKCPFAEKNRKFTATTWNRVLGKHLNSIIAPIRYI